MNKKVSKTIMSFILLIIIFASLASYVVYAAIENGISDNDNPNIFENIGGIAGKNEHTYEHIGRYIRRNDEADTYRYISQEQKDIVDRYLRQALGCSGPSNAWWTCSNHKYVWDLFVEYGVFTYADYQAYKTNQSSFQNGPLKKVKVTDVFDLEVNSQCTIGTLVSYLNNTSSNAQEILNKFSSVFCLRHNAAIPNWTDTFGHTNTFIVNKYINVTYDKTSRNVSSGDVSNVSYPTLSDYKDKSEDTTQRTKSNITYFLTDEENRDLHYINNGFGSYGYTNSFLYALSFSEKLSKNYLTGNYGNERAQKAIWAVVGASEYSYRNESSLYKAGKAVDYFESGGKFNPTVTKITGSEHDVTSATNINGVESVGTANKEPTGTMIYKDSNGVTTYRIGPFKMSDYTYVNCDYAAFYSGSALTVDPALVGGIVYGELEFNNGKKVPIGYNEKLSESSTNISFTRTDGVGNARIVYSDLKGNATSQGANNRAPTYCSVPTDYQYPWPNSVFYIDVPVNECGGANTLKGINFEYRKTYTEGTGWVVTGKYVQTDWEVENAKVGCTTYTASCHGNTFTKYLNDINASRNISVTCNYKCGGCVANGTDSKGNTKYTCPGHTHTPTLSFTCSTHSHSHCQSFNWKKTSSDVVLAQPFLAVHDACTKVDTYTRTSYLNVRLTTDITIKKYISKVEHTGEDKSLSHLKSYKDHDSIYDSEFENTNRANNKNQTVKVERGDRITYDIVLKNSSNITVKSQIKDILPNYCIFESIKVDGKDLTIYHLTEENSGKYNNEKYFFTSWVEVPGYGSTIVKVTLIATASDATITNKNTATLVSANAGRDIGSDGISQDDESINYTRLTNGSGSVVNNAQISGGNLYNTLEDSEYYTVKSYSVVLDKYITKVEHVTTSEVTYERYKGSLDILNDTYKPIDSNYVDRDTYNENSPKEQNPIYVEYGDRVTYDIDIQNTWNSNNKEMNQGSSVDKSINTNPYYAPNYIKLDLTDRLPDCYQKGSLKVEYILHETGYGNDQSGNSKTEENNQFYYTENNRIIEMRDIYVNPNSEATIRISFIVNTNQTGTKYANKVEIDPDGRAGLYGGSGYGKSLDYEVRNINNYYIFNTSNKSGKIRVSSEEYFMLNDYNVKIDKFISEYREEKLKENNQKEFEEYYSTDLSGREMENIESANSNEANAKDNYRKEHPISVEKYETLEYKIKAYNFSKEDNKSSSSGKYYKPATTVRVSSVRDKLDQGLVLDTNTVTAVIKNSSGAITKNIGKIYPVSLGNNTYDFNIHNKNNSNQWTVLEPGEYIEYTMEVEVQRTNMELYNLENKVNINVLTDINNTSSADNNHAMANAPRSGDHTRKVTERNTSQIKTSSDYIRLKDLIISGKVWLDLDKNGYMSSYNGLGSLKAGDSSNVTKEKVMKGIIVRLYKSDGTQIRTTITDENGLYTFAREDGSDSAYRKGMNQRIDKATNKDANGNYVTSSKLIDYYVEFEYDGILYKATEIYGGDYQRNNVEQNYGDKNLNREWLPSTSNTNTNYKTDSNAYEFTDVREEFNKKYETISYNKAYSFNGSTYDENGIGNIERGDQGELSYSKKDHESYLNIDHNRKMTSRTFILKGSKETDSNNIKLLWLFKNNITTKYPETEYLKYMNLGLQEREDVDISLTKDVYEVKTTINGEEMTYSYDQNKTVNGENTTTTEDNKYLRDYIVNEPYGLTLYESDFKYRHNYYSNTAVQEYKGKESELNVEVTYKITLNSKTITNDHRKVTSGEDYDDVKLDTRIHEIVDLYDQNFMTYNDNPEKNIIEVRQKDSDDTFSSTDKQIKIAEAWYYDESGNKKELELSNSSKYTKYTDKDNNFTTDGYKTLYIRGTDNKDLILKEGGKFDIYVKYVLDKEADEKDGQEANALKIKEYIDSKKNGRGIENIAQVNAYSVWYEDGKPTSIVDCDSNVGNIGINNNNQKVSADEVAYYEDTVYKTGIDITVPNSPNPPKEVETGTSTPESEKTKLLRTISGKVWDDSRTEPSEEMTEPSRSSDTQYSGDGEFNTSKDKNADAKMNATVTKCYKDESVTEKKDIEVRNAKVEYVELVKMKVGSEYRTYEETLSGDKWHQVQNTRTNDKGEYTLSGFIPGYYIVRYTYGDTTSDNAAIAKDMQIFNGQDYKSTKYTGVEDTETDEDKIIQGMEIANKSDARDDEIRRLDVMAYSETMINKKAEILKGLANESVLSGSANTPEQLKELTDNTYMYADTVRFYVKPEKLEKLTNPDKLSVRPSYTSLFDDILKFLYSKLMNLDFKDTPVEERIFNIKNLDFGMEYRPESQISLNKEISAIKLITSDGTELVKLALETEHRGEGNNQRHIIKEESKGLEYTQFISNDYTTIDPYSLTSEDVQGFVFINVDEEILQGSTIEIEYSFVAENDSEIDRISKNLDILRYRENTGVSANSSNFAYVSIKENDRKQGEAGDKDYVYTAAGTAANILRQVDGYGKTTDTKGTYTTKDKKFGDYYGKYLGEFYYTGNVGDDVISSLKFDKILDYVDTDLVFESSKSGIEKDTLWSTTTDENLIGFVKGLNGTSPVGSLLFNRKNTAYVTYKDDKPLTSNLVISVDDSVKNNDETSKNPSLSRFLKPTENGTIKLNVSKVISSETKTDDMEYENIAEVIQFTAQNGRRTNYATTIGNANVSSGEFDAAKTESDTTATEVITLTPPTGLSRINRVIRNTVETTGKGIGVVVIGVALVLGGILIVRFITKKVKKRAIK